MLSFVSVSVSETMQMTSEGLGETMQMYVPNYSGLCQWGYKRPLQAWVDGKGGPSLAEVEIITSPPVFDCFSVHSK